MIVSILLQMQNGLERKRLACIASRLCADAILLAVNRV